MSTTSVLDVVPSCSDDGQTSERERSAASWWATLSKLCCKLMSRMYSRNAAGLSDELGCCLHGNGGGGGGSGDDRRTTSGDEVCSFCSSKNADVTDVDDDVTAGRDDVKATDAGCKLNIQHKFYLSYQEFVHTLRDHD